METSKRSKFFAENLAFVILGIALLIAVIFYYTIDFSSSPTLPAWVLLLMGILVGCIYIGYKKDWWGYKNSSKIQIAKVQKLWKWIVGIALAIAIVWVYIVWSQPARDQEAAAEHDEQIAKDVKSYEKYIKQSDAMTTNHTTAVTQPVQPQSVALQFGPQVFSKGEEYMIPFFGTIHIIPKNPGTLHVSLRNQATLDSFELFSIRYPDNTWADTMLNSTAKRDTGYYKMTMLDVPDSIHHVRVEFFSNHR